MQQSAEYLARAEEAERTASEAKQPSVRDEYLKIAAGWRDLARQSADIATDELRRGR